jgi:hypothetical protein
MRLDAEKTSQEADMTGAMITCPKCDREVAGQADRCPACGYDLKRYRRIVGAAKPVDAWNATSLEDLKRALQFDTRRQARLDMIYFGGMVIVTAGFALITLTSGSYGPIGQIDFLQFAGSVTGLAVALILLWVGLRAVGIILNLPYIWQLLIKIADQQTELLAEVQNSRTSETTRPD